MIVKKLQLIRRSSYGKVWRKYEEIRKQARILNELKVDGIIVADGGVLEILKEEAPDVEKHISTQANTVSYHASKFWYNNGAKRVILGRELNKEQIKWVNNHQNIEMTTHYRQC